VGQASACREPVAPLAITTPSLDVPPLDAGPEPSSRTKNGAHFTHPVPRTGTAWRITVSAVSRSHDPSGDVQVTTYDSNVRVEVLAVDGPAPSRVRLRFLQNEESFQGSPKPTLVHHKEYFVDARAPHVRDAADVAAPEAEAQRVLDVFPDLGTRTRIDQLMPEVMQVGERRDELAAALLRIVHPRAWTSLAGSATLARVDGEHAVFEVSLDASSESGLHMVVSGEARIALADAELVELSLDGNYDPKKTTGAPEPGGSLSYRRRVTSDPSPRNDR
jgi:hypothetical protein